MTTDTLQKPTYTGNNTNPYSYDNSTLRLLPKLNKMALEAGIPDGDAEDVVQTAILNFWQGDRPAENEMRRGVFRKVVTPLLYDHMRQAIDGYHNTQRVEEPTDFELPPKDDLASNNPSFYLIAQQLWGDKPGEEEPVIDSAFEIDPLSERERDVAAFDRYTLFRKEIFNALFDLNALDWAPLQQKYRFHSTDVRTYWGLVKQPPTQTEETIAEYVAFGTEKLNAEQILRQPDFYRALHDVLRSVEFVSPFEYADGPLTEPMRRTRGGHEESRDYARLRASLTSKRPSAGDITTLLTDSATREKIGTSKLSKLWQLLPRHRRRGDSHKY